MFKQGKNYVFLSINQGKSYSLRVIDLGEDIAISFNSNVLGYAFLGRNVSVEQLKNEVFSKLDLTKLSDTNPLVITAVGGDNSENALQYFTSIKNLLEEYDNGLNIISLDYAVNDMVHPDYLFLSLADTEYTQSSVSYQNTIYIYSAKIQINEATKYFFSQNQSQDIQGDDLNNKLQKYIPDLHPNQIEGKVTVNYGKFKKVFDYILNAEAKLFGMEVNNLIIERYKEEYKVIGNEEMIDLHTIYNEKLTAQIDFFCETGEIAGNTLSTWFDTVGMEA